MRSRSLLLNTAVAAAAVLVSVGIGEAALRVVVDLPVRRVLPEIRYAPHPVRRFTLLPDQQGFSYGAPARIDRRGFRVNADAAPEGAVPVRVLALGDSFTFGLGVRNEETWPSQLEGRLKAHARTGVEVINAGTISYGVYQEMDLLRTDGLATSPAIVIHALYWNDFMNPEAPLPGSPPVIDAQGYFVWDHLSEPRGAWGRLLSRASHDSALLYTLKAAIGTMRRSHTPSSGYGRAHARLVSAGLTDAEWRPIERFYDELNQLAAEVGFLPFAVIMPVSDILTGAAPSSHPYSIRARSILERASIPYVDAFAVLARENRANEMFRPEGTDAHLNAAGYAKLADALARAMLAEPRAKSLIVR